MSLVLCGKCALLVMESQHRARPLKIEYAPHAPLGLRTHLLPAERRALWLVCPVWLDLPSHALPPLPLTVSAKSATSLLHSNRTSGTRRVRYWPHALSVKVTLSLAPPLLIVGAKHARLVSTMQQLMMPRSVVLLAWIVLLVTTRLLPQLQAATEYVHHALLVTLRMPQARKLAAPGPCAPMERAWRVKDLQLWIACAPIARPEYHSLRETLRSSVTWYAQTARQASS